MLWVLGAWGTYAFLQKIPKQHNTTAFDSALLTAERSYQDACDRYVTFNRSNYGAAGPFWKKKKQLEALHAEWNSLPTRRAAQVQKFEQDRFKQQLEQYLENFFIEHAIIPGIGAGRKATLESYGIETAADLEKKRILAVPGFGPAMAEKLLEWRRTTERKFRFDPSKRIDPQKLLALDRDIAIQKRKIEQALIAGSAELSQVKRQTEQQGAKLRGDVEHAVAVLVGARANQRAAAG